MAYQSWSVVFGEQPSAAKWNILGTNDAHFDGLIGLTGVNTVLHNINHQSNTTNSLQDSVMVQYGWGWILGAAANFVAETVTFPVAYDSAPTVIMNAVNTLSGSNPAAISDLVSLAGVYGQAGDITTTGFEATILERDGAGTLSTSIRYGYSWIAIGVNA